jgi:hypothetical protein
MNTTLAILEGWKYIFFLILTTKALGFVGIKNDWRLHGVICSKTPFLKNWIGFSLPLPRLPLTLTLLLKC